MSAMPARPNLTCRTCTRSFTPKPQRGPKPLYCSRDCKTRWQLDHRDSPPTCTRCGKEFAKRHFSQRYCTDCAEGCRVCGKALVKEKQHRMSPVYCSTTCQDRAWAHTPLPLCPGYTDKAHKHHPCTNSPSGKPRKLTLPRPPKALRDPPTICQKCWLARRMDLIGVEAMKAERTKGKK